MDLKNLLPDTPKMSAGELDDWLREHGGRKREVLRYRKRFIKDEITGEKTYYAETFCTRCYGECDLEIFDIGSGYPRLGGYSGAVANGEMIACPCCGDRIEAAYYDRLRRHPIKAFSYPWEIIKKDGCIMFICWAVCHEIGHDYDSVEVFKRNAYMLDTEGKWHRFTGMARSGWSSMSAMEYIGIWYEKEKFDVADGNFKLMLPYEETVFEGTLLENAKIEKLYEANPSTDLITYARIYLKHKTIENLAMQSPTFVIAAMRLIGGVNGLNWINFNARKPHEMLRVTKDEYKRLCGLGKRKIDSQLRDIYIRSACNEWNIPTSYSKTLGMDGAHFAFRQKRNKILRQYGLVTIWNYILKQKKSIGYNDETICEDYWKDLPKVGADTANRAVMFPSDLREAHARVISAIQYKVNEELREKFTKRSRKLEPISWSNKGLMIIPAKSESELIAEGKALEHCVGGYAEEHCKGNSILFIRHTDKPDIPYFTLQLNTKTGRVIQNRGYKNCARTKEVEEFEELWISTIVLPWLSKKKRRQHNGRNYCNGGEP